MNFWQIAAGYQRVSVDLKDIFLKLNVALIGPGELGNFFDKKQKYKDKYSSESRDFIILKAFCEEANIGDIFVLREAVNPREQKWRIIAVGEVISPYRYEPIFDYVDVENWDIQHCRRVKWIVPEEEVIASGGISVRFQKIDEANNELAKEAKKMLGI